MFILHSSNKTENLVQHLSAVLNTMPLSSPFAEELFLIQSQGMERWLSQQLAVNFKVWGNFRYLFPGKFFSTLTGRILQHGNDAAFDRHLLLWHFESLLRDIKDKDFQPLQHYLAGEQADIRRYQLAQQLARIFDQYQMLRPEMLESWQQGQYLYNTATERWQQALWQRITARLGQQHRGKIWQQIIQRLLKSAEGEFSSVLPERISVFGINTVPPLLLAYLQALSRHCDIHLYLLNPVQSYWADLPSKRLLAQLTEFDGHPLLVALGQQGREFQQLLLEQVEFHYEPKSFEEPECRNNLQVLQTDILNNTLSLTTLSVDTSISIHACHSRLREVQVLKNQLLATLESQLDLELRDIVVMAPDIQLYAPFINAVFSDIQHAIADRSLRTDNSAMNALMVFLELSQSRMGWQSVLDLLEQPLIYANFGLQESDFELIRYWIADTHVRWGQSAKHKQALGLPATHQNTWQAMLDRLFMGYATGSDQAFIEDILPYPDIEGTSSQALGGLNDFLQLLFRAADELQGAKPLIEWHHLLTFYAEKLLSKADQTERQPINELLAEIVEIATIHQQPVKLAVMLAWLDGRLDESKSSNGFLRGQLTFCSMLPMRSIPFQVIALLGMNDGEFPKVERSPGFDLIAHNPRLGDRSRRADDRYQFLEILLSARRQLIITYLGLSQRDNSEIPPSVIISELLDVLRDSYQLKDRVVEHLLHPFSPHYFNGQNPQLFSYSASDYAIATQLRTAKSPLTEWWQGELTVDAGEPIAIDELLRFYNHPQRFFLKNQLGISLPGVTEEAEEREPFQLDTLDNYQIQARWIAESLKGNTLSVEEFQARGLWPTGVLGQIEWQRQQPEIAAFVNSVRKLSLGHVMPSLAIDKKVGAYRLVGKIRNQYQQGGLLYRYSNVKGKDFIGAWLQHLIVNQLRAQTTYLLAKDCAFIFTPEQADENILIALIEIFLHGKQRPDVFFTEAVMRYLQQKNPETALDKVMLYMAEVQEKGYEPEITQVLKNKDLVPLFDQRFAEQCQNLFQSAWSARHDD